MKVRFINLKEEHLDLIRNWRNSPEVSKFMYTDHHISKEEHRKWFNRIKDDPTKSYWIIEVDNNYVGVVNLYDINMLNRRCYWGFYLADSSVRGKGVGRLVELNILTYVFESLNLNKLCGEVLSSNDIAVTIHKKYGSKIEGKFRQHVCKGGIFHDIVCIGILKEEWLDLKKKFKFEKIEIK